jgi:hypothetical protein
MKFEVRWVDKTGKKEKLCCDSVSPTKTLKLVKSIMNNMAESNKIIITKE